MRRIALLALLLAAGVLGVQQATAAAPCSTTAVADGPWTAAATWDRGVPAPDGHACVPAGRSVAIASGTVNVASVAVDGVLRVTGGRLNLTSTSDESTARALELAGTLGGAGTVRISESLTWAGGAMADGGRTVVAPGALAVQQTATVGLWDARSLEIAGTLRFGGPTATGISRSGTPVIHVLPGGLIEKASPAASGIDPVVDNDGRIEATIAGSTLELNTGGPAGSSSGSFGAPGAAGTVRFDGAVAHVLADGAALRGGVAINGTVSVPAGATVTATGANAMSAGEVAGDGTLAIDGAFGWTGGAMGDAGVTRVLPGATLTQQANTVGLWDARILDVAGTLALATAERGISRSGTPRITVAGTGLIRKTSTGASGIDPVVHNGGRVEATAAGGTLELNTGGGAGASDGDFGAPGQAGTVRFDGSVAHRLADGARLLGGTEIAGAVEIPAGATVAATGANRMSAGEVAGDGTLAVDGTFAWSGGAMGDGGVTRVLPGATLTHQNNTIALWDTRRLENAGTILLAAADRHVNRSGTPIVHNLAGASIRKTAGGATTIDPALENDGTVTAEIAGSTLTVRGGTAGAVSTGAFGGAGTVRLDSFSAGRFVLGAGAALPGGVALASGAVEVAEGATVPAAGALTLAGGTLGGAGTLAVTGTMTWTGGSMGGTGVTAVAPAGTLALPGDGGFQLGGTRTLAVAGVLDAANDASLFGTTALLHVLPTGVLRKSGGDAYTFVDVPLRNDGTVEGLAGQLRLFRGAAEPHTGRFHSASATAFASLAGRGHAVTGAVRLGDFTRIDGDVAVRAGDTLVLADDVTQSGGDLSGDVRVTGTLTWAAGSHAGPGATTIESGGDVVIDRAGPDACATTSLAAGRRLVNRGSLRLADGSHLGAFGDERPEIHNAGRLELDSGGGGCGGYAGIAGEALLRNTGAIVKSGGAGSSYIGSALENDGTILNSAPGELRLASTAALGHAGTFASTAGAVAFDSGTFVLEPGAAFDGDAAVDGAELRLPAGTALHVQAGDALRLSAGSIAGAGELRVSGALTWTGGTQEGEGTTVIAEGGTATVAPAEGDDRAFVSLGENRGLVNGGATAVRDATFWLERGASLLNRGTLELRGKTRLGGSSHGSAFGSLLHNAGTLRTGDGSAIESDVPLDNDGLLEIGTGTAELGGLLNHTGNGFFGESGLVGGRYVVRGTLVVPGAMSANGAALTLDGPASRVVTRSFSGTETDALAGLHRNAAGGELVLRGGRSLGLARPFLNHGVLDLGPASTLHAAGFRQAAGAVLRPAVAAGGVGRVVATAPAELGGRLDTPAAVAVAGDAVVLSAPAVSGAFAAVSGAYEALQGATDVTLRPPAPRFGPTGTSTEPGEGAGGTGGEPAGGDAAVRRMGRTALAAGGSWIERETYLVARRRGATLTARDVRGRRVALVARTCRRCGAVRVTWAGRHRDVSLRSARPGRRRIGVFRTANARGGTLRVRTTSARRVAIRAVLVAR